MVLPANQGIQTQQSIDRATKGQGKIVHAQKEDILKTHAAGPCEGVTQGVDRQVAMEHPLEVPRVGERVISYTRRDIAKDAILEPGLVSSQRSEEHTSELQSHSDLVCRLLLEKKKKRQKKIR